MHLNSIILESRADHHAALCSATHEVRNLACDCLWCAVTARIRYGHGEFTTQRRKSKTIEHKYRHVRVRPYAVYMYIYDVLALSSVARHRQRKTSFSPPSALPEWCDGDGCIRVAFRRLLHDSGLDRALDDRGLVCTLCWRTHTKMPAREHTTVPRLLLYRTTTTTPAC